MIGKPSSRRQTRPIRQRMTKSAAENFFASVSKRADVDMTVRDLKSAGYRHLAERIVHRRELDLSITWELERARQMLGRTA